MANELEANGHVNGHYSYNSSPNGTTADSNGEAGHAKTSVAEEKISKETRFIFGGDAPYLAGKGYVWL